MIHSYSRTQATGRTYQSYRGRRPLRDIPLAWAAGHLHRKRVLQVQPQSERTAHIGAPAETLAFGMPDVWKRSRNRAAQFSVFLAGPEQLSIKTSFDTNVGAGIAREFDVLRLQ